MNMKKIYMKPEVVVIEAELEQMIAASEMTIDIDNGTSDDPEGADARLFFDDEEWW